MEFDSTFLIAVISFIIFVLIMNRIFYAPILKIMRERQELVEQNFKSAKAAKEETDKKINYHNSELEKSRDEARSIISETTKQLKQERTEEIAKFKENMSENISRERENLRNSALEAKEILKDNVVDIAREISIKLLGNTIDSVSINKSQIQEEQG